MSKIILVLVGIALIVLVVVTWRKSLTIVENGVIISTRNNVNQVDYKGGKEVDGDSYHPYLIKSNYNDAVKKALDKAGPEYDMLIDATLKVNYYYLIIYFSNYITVKGTAVNSSELKTEMGEEKYNLWLSEKNILQK